MKVKAPNWFASLFLIISPAYLWASEGQSGSAPQIIETKGFFDRFGLDSPLPSDACLEQAKKDIYVSESGSALIFADGPRRIIDEILVVDPGIFTQRYITIGQSTMRDVLQRYGSANIDTTYENFVLLTYPQIGFVFDKVTADKADPLMQTVRFIELGRHSTGWGMLRVMLSLSVLFDKTSRLKRTQCDASSLWNHIYHPNRLIVIQQCTCVTGTIVDATNGRLPDGVRHEPDGDAHGWLQVDSGYQLLLNDANTATQGGNLVFEIVCRYPVRQADAKAACQGYSDQVILPPVGSHVRMVGTYVQDTIRNQWMEIHPVTSITVIP